MSAARAKYLIGGARVVWSETIFLPDGADLTAHVDLDETDSFKVRIQFSSDEPEAGKVVRPLMRWESSEDALDLQLVNFDGAKPNSAPDRMVEIGATNSGEPIYFFATVTKFKGHRRLEVQFTVGEVKLGGSDGAAN